MTKPWTPVRRAVAWARGSHERAIANARGAATELSRGRVEREEVELFLLDHGVRRPARPAASRPA